MFQITWRSRPKSRAVRTAPLDSAATDRMVQQLTADGMTIVTVRRVA